MGWLPLADAFSQVDQQYLLEARQMQALSLGVHIPLVCFGVAFPAIVLFMEGLYHRTGNVVYRQIAKRWSKVMLILFAVGVVTGTILSFELGLLWPGFMEAFGDVFGLAFALEGLSFFIEAIFITIYVYGWDRLKDRTHFLVGIPIVITGLTGSFLVISVNGWMNNPTGFDIDNAGNVTHVEPLKALFNDYFWHEWFHMYTAGFIVAAFLVAGVYAHSWLKGKRSHYYRAALIVPLTVACIAAPVQLLMGDWAGRTVAEAQPTKLASFEGLEKTTKGAPFTLGGIYIDGENKGGITIPDMLSILAFHDPNATVQGLDATPKEEQPPVGVVRNAFTVMVFIGIGPGDPRRALFVRLVPQGPAAAHQVVLPARRARGAGGLRRPDRRLDHDRGRPAAVDRLRRDEDRGGGDGGRGNPDRLRDAGGRLPRGSRRSSSSCSGAWRSSRSSRSCPAPGTGVEVRPDVGRPPVAVLVLGLVMYSVLGGADFGAGFWDLTAGGAERGARVRGMLKRSMSPVWEANHVWLIFVLVVFWTGFPKAFGPVMETLYVPLFLAALGIIFRGSAFALRGEAATISEARALGATFALSSVLVPFCLGATIGAIASGQVGVPADPTPRSRAGRTPPRSTSARSPLPRAPTWPRSSSPRMRSGPSCPTSSRISAGARSARASSPG